MQDTRRYVPATSDLASASAWPMGRRTFISPGVASFPRCRTGLIVVYLKCRGVETTSEWTDMQIAAKTNNEMVRTLPVVIIDDDAWVRPALRALLESEP